MIVSTYPFLVRLLVEVIEQEVEHDGVQQDDPSECLRVIALSEQQLGRVDEHHNELDLKYGRNNVEYIVGLRFAFYIQVASCDPHDYIMLT